MLIHADIPVKGARVGVLGLTFKENVPDLRNSRVLDIVTELRQFGIEPLVHDPVADREEALHEYGIQLKDFSEMNSLDGIVIAVGHNFYAEMSQSKLAHCVKSGGVVVDVKSVLDEHCLPENVEYWAL